MQSGKVYQGVLRAVSPQLSIALALAHDKAKKMTKGNTDRLMQLEFADIISFSSFPESNPNLSKGQAVGGVGQCRNDRCTGGE